MILSLHDDVSRIFYSEIPFLIIPNFENMIQYILANLSFHVESYEFPKDMYYMAEYNMHTKVFRKLQKHECFILKLILKDGSQKNIRVNYSQI